MKIKYAYIHPHSREYLYTESREELQEKLAEFAAQVYAEHYCNGAPYSIVKIVEDGTEKWYSPTGEQVMTAEEIKIKIKQMQIYMNAGEIPVSVLGG